MTTQPSDWAVAKAFYDHFSGYPSPTLRIIEKRARELDASGGGSDDDMAMHWIDRYAAGLDDVCQLDRIREALAPRAAEAGDKDGERYRWLRDEAMKRQFNGQKGEGVFIAHGSPYTGFCAPTRSRLDDIVDAAMAALAVGGGE